MLILSRKIGETITIGEQGEIRATVLAIKSHQVRIGIIAPRHICVHREEIFERIQQEQLAAANEKTYEPEEIA